MRAQSPRVPPEWAGQPAGPMREASFPFPCVGPCGAICAAGTLAQPYRDYNMAGSRGEWQRICRACCGRMRARVRWDNIRRALTAYSLLAHALLPAQARAAKRAYAPGGAGYMYARDDFEACVHARKQQRL